MIPLARGDLVAQAFDTRVSQPILRFGTRPDRFLIHCAREGRRRVVGVAYGPDARIGEGTNLCLAVDQVVALILRGNIAWMAGNFSPFLVDFRFEPRATGRSSYKGTRPRRRPRERVSSATAAETGMRQLPSEAG